MARKRSPCQPHKRKRRSRRTIVDVHVGPFVEPKTNHPRPLSCDAGANESGYLNGPRVLDAEVNEWAGGEIVDGGG